MRQMASKGTGGADHGLICVGDGLASWQQCSRGSSTISSNTDNLSSEAKIKLDKHH